jgi:hypothetical protein
MSPKKNTGAENKVSPELSPVRNIRVLICQISGKLPAPFHPSPSLPSRTARVVLSPKTSALTSKTPTHPT